MDCSFYAFGREIQKTSSGIKKRLADVLRDIEKDPFQPHLKYHHLGGKLKGIQAVSINDKYRVSLTVAISEKEVVLLDVGSHEELYGKR